MTLDDWLTEQAKVALNRVEFRADADKAYWQGYADAMLDVRNYVE